MPLGAMQSWPIQEAKARLSELVKRAQRRPQQFTSHGETVAVVISAQEWERQQNQEESLVAFIRRSPLVGVEDLTLERCSDLPRDLDL